MPVRKLITWDPVKALYVGPVPLIPFKVRWGRVKDNVAIFRNYWQNTQADSRFHRLDVVGHWELGNLFANAPHGEEVDTDLQGERVDQIRVETRLPNAHEVRDRLQAYDDARESVGDSNPLFNSQPNEPQWGLWGREVNHQSIAWYAYRRTVNEMLL